MNRASSSIHLESLGSASDYSDFPDDRGQSNVVEPNWSYCANSDLFKKPSSLWGQRKLSDEEYARQAEAMKEFCRWRTIIAKKSKPH